GAGDRQGRGGGNQDTGGLETQGGGARRVGADEVALDLEVPCGHAVHPDARVPVPGDDVAGPRNGAPDDALRAGVLREDALEGVGGGRVAGSVEADEVAENPGAAAPEVDAYARLAGDDVAVRRVQAADGVLATVLNVDSLVLVGDGGTARGVEADDVMG